MNKSKPSEIESDEAVEVLRNYFKATCPICGKKALKDTTSIEREAGWLYYSTRFECEQDNYWLMTRIEEFNAIESDVGQDITEVRNSDHAAVKLDTHLTVMQYLISEGVENYTLDCINQKCNAHGEYFITRSMSDGSIDGLSIYFAIESQKFADKFQLSKAAIAMRFAIDYLELTNFSDHDTIIRIAGSEAEGQKVVRKLLAACRQAGFHAKARRVEAELAINYN